MEVNVNNSVIFNEIFTKAKIIFKAPSITYSYDNIVLGCDVHYEGKKEKMYAVAPNTWRGFHKINKANEGAGTVFKDYLIQNKDVIIAKLKEISTAEQLDVFEDSLCTGIKVNLRNIKHSMMHSYNKLRKPVDLYIEHIVAMASELDGYRDQLVKLLFIPLDSQMFQSLYIFDINDLSKYSLSRRCSFSDVDTKPKYDGLQSILASKARSISHTCGVEYERIYFDLIWGDRYKQAGENLFQTNL